VQTTCDNADEQCPCDAAGKLVSERTKPAKNCSFNGATLEALLDTGSEVCLQGLLSAAQHYVQSRVRAHFISGHPIRMFEEDVLKVQLGLIVRHWRCVIV